MRCSLTSLKKLADDKRSSLFRPIVRRKKFYNDDPWYGSGLSRTPGHPPPTASWNQNLPRRSPQSRSPTTGALERLPRRLPCRPNRLTSIAKGATTLNITTFNITTLSIMTQSITIKNATLSIMALDYC
jgi:hypothetical protein